MIVAAQIYDLSETYVSRGCERSVQGVRVFGLTKDGQSVSVVVLDTPHEIYMDPKREELGMTDFATQMNERLLKSPHPCRRTDCACETKAKTRGSYDPSYESCVKDRRTDRVAVSAVECVMRKGFETYEPAPRQFWKFTLTRSYYAKAAKKFIESRHADAYECCADPVQSFVRLKNFAGFEWYTWPSHSSHVRFDEFQHTEWQGMAPFRVASIDIETIAQKYTNSESEAAAYPVGCICVDDGTERAAYVFGDQVQFENSQCFLSELDMLKAFKQNIERAHVWTGWNSDGFDLPYVFKRAEVLGDATFCAFSQDRVVRFTQDPRTRDRKVHLPGVIFLDYCKVVMRDTRVRPYDYKLNTIAEHFNLGSKHDMPYAEIYSSFHGTREMRTALVSYCMQDASLALRIGKTIGAFTKLVAKARVKRVRPQDELYRGAAFVTKRKVQEYLREEFLMMSPKEEYVNNEKRKIISEATREIQGMDELLAKQGYVGGFVRDPVLGLYRDFSVGTLDFNSLYPSIMRTYNMCKSTQLKRPGEHANEWVSSSGFAFAQTPEGVFPKIMREMVQERAKVRESMKRTTNAEELEQLDALQTELKIVANSLYGQTGASTSELYLKSAAECTCRRGAELAQLACHVLDEDPRLPKEWTKAQREEYEGRMRAFENSLENREEFVRRRSLFKRDMGLTVIYGDTDSLMIWFSKSKSAEQTLAWLTSVADYVNRESGILGKAGILKMGMEDASCMLLCGKKMYVKYSRSIQDGGLSSAPKMKIVGMDNRSKTPFVRDRMRMMMERALKDGATDVSKEYEDAIRTVASGALDHRLLKHTSKLTKDLDLYGVEAHAVAARQLVHRGARVCVGDRVEYYRCLIVNSGPKKADCVVAADVVEEEKYDLDWKSYVEETAEALKPLRPIIRSYDELSRASRYAIRSGRKKLPPAQGSGKIVGDKRRVLTPQAGPMDNFVKRLRDFDEMISQCSTSSSS